MGKHNIAHLIMTLIPHVDFPPFFLSPCVPPFFIPPFLLYGIDHSFRSWIIYKGQESSILFILYPQGRKKRKEVDLGLSGYPCALHLSSIPTSTTHTQHTSYPSLR